MKTLFLAAVFAVSSALALPPSKRSSASTPPPAPEPDHKYDAPAVPERQAGQDAGAPSAQGGKALRSSEGVHHGSPTPPSATPGAADDGPAGGLGEGAQHPSGAGAFLGGVLQGGPKTDNGKGNGGVPGNGGQNNGGGKKDGGKSQAAGTGKAAAKTPAEQAKPGKAPASKPAPAKTLRRYSTEEERPAPVFVGAPPAPARKPAAAPSTPAVVPAAAPAAAPAPAPAASPSQPASSPRSVYRTH